MFYAALLTISGRKPISRIILGIISVGFVFVPIAYGSHKTSLPTDHPATAIHRMLSYINRSGQSCDPNRILAYLNQGASPNTMDSSSSQPLIMTLSYGAENCALLLLDHGAMSGIRKPVGPVGVFALTIAAGANTANTCSPKVIEALIKHGADPNAISAWKQSPLLNAAMEKHVQCAKALLESGAEVNLSGNPRAITPLMAAQMPGFRGVWGHDVKERVRMTRLLLKHKADPNLKMISGQTALFIAVGLAHSAMPCVRCAKLLLQAGADPNVVDKVGDTPLLWALMPNHRTSLMAVKVLVKGGANVNLASPKTGETPLMAAAARGDERIVRYLLRVGAQPCAHDKAGRMAANYAREHHYSKLVKLLSCHAH